MKAVHFGAGNIGRGFIGAELQDAGYFVYFADVNQQVIDQLNNQGHYDVIELGENGKTKRYQNFSALNSVSQKDELVSVIASADVVTASQLPAFGNGPFRRAGYFQQLCQQAAGTSARAT